MPAVGGWNTGEFMGVLRIIEYIDLTLLGVILVLSALNYVRLRRALFLLVGGGAAIFICHIALNMALATRISPPGEVWLAAIEAAALFFWMLASMYEDKRMGARLVVWAVIFGTVFLYTVIPVIVLARPQPRFSYPALFLLYEICMIVYCLINIPARLMRGRHYLFQAFIFIVIGIAFSIFLDLPGGADREFGIIAAVAYGFGFLSMVLFVDAATVSALGEEIHGGELRAKLNDALAEIERGLQSIKDDIGREEIFHRGTAIIAETLRDRIGFQGFFLGRPTAAGPGFLFEDCLNRHADGRSATSLRSMDPIISEIANTRIPVSVSDARKDPRIADLSHERIGMNSFLGLPIIIKDKLEAIILLGDHDSAEAFTADASLLDYIAGQISLFISYLNLRSEILTAPETDAVTLLRNFTSFQKLLSDSIDTSDKTGATLALILFDVDHFSSINEKIGFARGDQLLRDIGIILSKYAAPGCTGRVGADEFAMLLPGETDAIRARIQNDLPTIAEQIKQVCQDFPVTLSVAFAIYPFDFFEKTGIFSKIREMLAAGRTATSQIVHVKVG